MSKDEPCDKEGNLIDLLLYLFLSTILGILSMIFCFKFFAARAKTYEIPIFIFLGENIKMHSWYSAKL